MCKRLKTGFLFSIFATAPQLDLFLQQVNESKLRNLTFSFGIYSVLPLSTAEFG
jgi:hypothetical protein